ncbi:T9SS type A sorting domain-containing protein [candidate division KSB1 bacterium]|nr:T9SS type A sorting domain-containing protein [candidate division KSB1 bacterium]
MRIFNSFIGLVILSAMSLIGDADANMTIRITGIQNGQRFEACSDIMVGAEITVESGEIKRVYFYHNKGSFGSVSNAPWEKLWEEVEPGIYDISAKVKDTDNNEFFSDTLQIFVDPISDGNILINGEFACNTSPWQLQLNEGAQATLEIDDEGYLSDHEPMADIQISALGTENWHVMLVQRCGLDSGHVYEISFAAEVYDVKTIYFNFQEGGGDWTVYQQWTQDLDISEIYYGPYEYVNLINDPTADFKILLGEDTEDIFLDAVEIIDIGWEPRETRVKKETHVHPGHYSLYQNFPNPFNPTTEIKFSLPAPADINLSIYNVQGQLVQTLLNEYISQGQYIAQWDGTNLEGNSVPSGIYFYKLKTPETQLTNRMVLLK